MLELFSLFFVGIFTGSINVLAGGGSLISLPLLIFLGVPPLVANATNRVGIVMQNIFGIMGFHQKGVNLLRFSFPLALSSIVGATIGASFSLTLTNGQFKSVLAVVMIMVVAISIWNPSKRFSGNEERLSLKYWAITTFTFFFIGIYGGFIQAGVGFLSITATSFINRMDLVKANCVKITVALFYAATSVVVFALNDMIWWQHGIALGVGTALGAWFMSRHSVKKGHDWIKRLLNIIVVLMALRLFFS